jgi:biopolymer transport protein ExbD
MRNWTERKKPKARIEIIPMIDVMMFMLVFFVLISINVIPSLGIKTALPSSSQAQDLRSVSNVIVTLGKDDQLQVNGEVSTLDKVGMRIRSLEKPGQKLAIIINGDKGVDMQRLIDLMDALKGGGYDAVSIAAKKRA